MKIDKDQDKDKAFRPSKSDDADDYISDSYTPDEYYQELDDIWDCAG